MKDGYQPDEAATKHSGDFDAEKYKASSRHQKEWGARLIEELGLRGDERVIDLGCGDGVLTKRIADLLPRGSVLGIDSSPSMIATAKKLDGGNLSFLLLDVEELDLRDEFDVAFSNAAMHWVLDHDKLLSNVRNALRLGGVVRFNFAGDGNCSNFFAVAREVMARPEYRGYFEEMTWPWFMPTIDEYERTVAQAGFSAHRIWMENADRTFSEKELVNWIDQPSIVPLVAMVEPSQKSAFRDEVVKEMVRRTRTPEGRYFETFQRINLWARK